MTELAVSTMSESEAKRLTQRIELKLESAANAWEGAIDLIHEAYEKNIYIVLGYRSHGDYMREKFSASLSRLSTEQRKESVQELADMGLSVRAIAPIVGTSKSQVARDLATPVPSGTPEVPEPSDEIVYEVIEKATSPAREPLRESTSSVRDEERSISQTVGIDGKSYTAPVKKTPRRRPLIDVAQELGWEIRKRADKLERILDDDRFTLKNRDDLRAALRSHLIHMMDMGELALKVLGEPDQIEGD